MKMEAEGWVYITLIVCLSAVAALLIVAGFLAEPVGLEFCQ